MVDDTVRGKQPLSFFLQSADPIVAVAHSTHGVRQPLLNYLTLLKTQLARKCSRKINNRLYKKRSLLS